MQDKPKQDKLKQDKATTRTTLRTGRAWRTPAALTGLFLAGLSLTGFSQAAGAAPAAPALPKTDAALSQALAAPAKTGWIGVIVRTPAPLTPAQEAQMTALGADIIRRLPIIGSVAVRVPQRSLARLAALPFASHLSLDGAVKKSDDFTVGSSEASQAFAADAYGASYALSGQGVTVAVVDSGILAAHPDLQYPAPPPPVKGQPAPPPAPKGSRVLANVSFVAGPVPKGLPPDDPCGHGTHVSGIIGGNGNMSNQANCFDTFKGIAPQAALVGVRVLDQNGSSTVSTVLSGLQWVMVNQSQYNIRVVNLSLGHPVGESYTTDPICQAVEALYRSGIVVVCAAGNGGRLNGGTYTAGLDNEGWGTAYGSIQSPGNDPYVLTVGATKNMDGVRADDRIATYSSRGPSRLDLVMKPDIIAPGNKVISLDANNSTLDNYAGGTNDIPQSLYMNVKSLTTVSPSYFRLSGTSMASPVVAGAAALLLQANPNLSPDTVKARLMLSADKWYAPDGTQDPLTYGAGYLNIPAALASTAVAQGPAASPALVANLANGTLTVDLTRAMWGCSLWGTGVTDLRAMWGSRAMWGCTSVDMTRAMWGCNTTFTPSSALAASSAPSASRAMWGCSVWGDRAMWGCSSTTVDLTSTALSGE